jgi:hypothetical protein
MVTHATIIAQRRPSVFHVCTMGAALNAPFDFDRDGLDQMIVFGKLTLDSILRPAVVV